MMTKTAYYMQMAQEAAAQITGSKEQWTAFLTTSARLYKYPFAEQLMIYKQRPEATACAEYDLWNDRMNRYVKRGSKGIALLDMRGEQPKLRYVFDVADTGERKNSRPVQLWKMNAEHEQPIIRALDTAFDVSAGAGSLENHIMEAAERLARDYWEENRRQISDIVADSYLEGYDELNIGASFKRAAAVSIAYSVFTRTVGNADDYFEHEDFLDIFDFNTQAAANVLGTAVSEMSSQIFREIERTIRTYERDKQAERSQNYDGAELHEERRLPDSGHPVVGAGTEAPGQVREDAQSVSAGEQHAAVQSPDPDREAVPAPVGDSGDRDRTDGADDGGSSESESGTGQEIEPDGLGAAHEHAESAGRGSHSDGTYQQLNFMSLFQSEAEQIQKIDAAAENAAKEAESEKPSAFVISEDEIDRMLRTGSNFEGGKIRIYALYQQQGDAKERAAFLKAEYGLGGHSYTFMDGSRGFADYNGRGILLRNYDHDREVRLTWSAVDKRLDRLVENDQYLTALEMEEYRKLEQEYGAPLPMPTAAHVFPPTPPERYDTGNEHVDSILNTAANVYARSELAAPQRFTVMETDDGYAVWDDIQDGIHVEPDGVSEEFTSEWEAETYRQQLIEKVQEREAKDWLYVEQSKQNLQQDIPFPDVESEEVQESAHAETDPLVLEMQEHASELSRESGYAPDERFVVTMTGENFPDHLDVGWRPADMTQRNGRIIRQGNRNKEVQVYQYVTEGTFDAYLYQTLENKQKFISQIMTSKSPVRSCDDVDEQALSYAEIKALCAGDPQIKEKMDLDVDVARLKVLKADHQSQQYRLEDKLMKYFPAEIEKTQGFIKGFQSDIRTVAAHPLPEEGFCGMEVNGAQFTEKAEAGEAILAICKANQSLEPVPLGSYRGFKMELAFDSFQKEYQVLLKGEMTHRVPIGTSAAGNIQRLDNALAGIPARLEKAEQQLDSLRSQQEAAQAELGKPFPQEAELAEKSARLAELDALLNMDDRGKDDPDREKTTEKPSVLAELRDRAGRIPPMTHRDDEEVAL